MIVLKSDNTFQQYYKFDFEDFDFCELSKMSCVTDPCMSVSII